MSKGKRIEVSDDLVPQILKLQQTLRPVLGSASRRPNDPTIGALTADLAGLWEVSHRHQQHLAEIRKLKFPQDSKKLRELTFVLEVDWCHQARSHIESLKKLLPRFRKHLK